MSSLFPQQPEKPDQGQALGSLERMGIAVETKIDEAILTPSMAKAIRFRVSKPSGYSFQEVDDFVTNIVTPSIDWLLQTIYQRDSVVHALGRTLDQAETDNLNLKGQLTFAEYNSQIKKGIEQNSDDKEVTALMNRLVAAEAELAEYKSGSTQPSEEPSDISPSVEENEELKKYAESVVEQYNELSERYTADTSSLQAQIEQLQEANQNNPTTEDNLKTSESELSSTDGSENAAHIKELEDYIENITKQYNELLEAYNNIVENPTEEENGSTVSYEKYSNLLQDKEQLQEQLQNALRTVSEYEGKEFQEAETVKPARMLLATEENIETDSDNPIYKNLPPGIRPDDL